MIGNISSKNQRRIHRRIHLYGNRKEQRGNYTLLSIWHLRNEKEKRRCLMWPGERVLKFNAGGVKGVVGNVVIAAEPEMSTNRRLE
jgi:hypothetical protein